METAEQQQSPHAVSPLFWTQPSLTTFWSLMVASPRHQFSQLSQCGGAEGTVVEGGGVGVGVGGGQSAFRLTA